MTRVTGMAGMTGTSGMYMKAKMTEGDIFQWALFSNV